MNEGEKLKVPEIKGPTPEVRKKTVRFWADMWNKDWKITTQGIADATGLSTHDVMLFRCLVMVTTIRGIGIDIANVVRWLTRPVEDGEEWKQE